MICHITCLIWIENLVSMTFSSFWVQFSFKNLKSQYLQNGHTSELGKVAKMTADMRVFVWYVSHVQAKFLPLKVFRAVWGGLRYPPRPKESLKKGIFCTKQRLPIHLQNNLEHQAFSTRPTSPRKLKGFHSTLP